MSGGIQSQATGLDAIFDPLTSGQTPAAATGIQSNGADLNTLFAPLAAGSAADATGIQSAGADLNTFFAKIGTSSSSALPINGNTYTSSVNVTGSPTHAAISFSITGATWAIAGASGTLASGNVPSNAATVQYTWGSYTVPSGFVDAGGSTTNPAATAVSLSSNPSATYITADNSSSSGSRARQYPFAVDFFDAGGANISHSTCTLVGETEGSV